ncbi:WXG100 family type VII secretion target [Leucobacter rhizosphaerae]|uniref:WXG100 family type VII secretion target n=1 Tax=Leucobacter rhizosphaerae TaxID=2932245 RepID=A0ABY4FZD6_9MICO|nr:WXG100 family type VII secretion target [Leucobacter rhizosphaerae]UOQ61653.1 WXG100 family type VII secretion target [Leucobacter rhizosphaerae]
MANITVSYGEMESAASDIGSGREEITHILLRMKALIGRLVTSGFVTDQASGKFDEAFGSYTAHANGVIDQLTEIQRFITSTAALLRDTDSQIAARIS